MSAGERTGHRSLALGLLGKGRMGRSVESVAVERGHRIALRLGADDNRGGVGLTVEALAGVDVLVDFSAAAAVLDNVRGAVRGSTPLVLGTTGWNRREGALDEVRRLAEEGGIGLLFAPNFSFGMHRFKELALRAARLAGADEELDLWIEEAHHRGKADHPSGTALALAEAILEALPGKARLRTDLPEGPVDPEDLLVVASRGGWIPGTHRVVVDGPRETIELVHTVRSREVFAEGAVRAAEWLCGHTGFFTLDDLLREIEEDRNEQ